VTVVTAAVDLPLGTTIAADQLSTVQKPVADAIDTYRDPVQLEGQTVRRLVHKGQALTTADFQALSAGGADVARALKPGQRAMAVRVDSLSGVGSLIQAGDFVDVIAAVSDETAKFPVVLESEDFAPSEEGKEPFTKIDDVVNSTSVKVLVQNVQVVGVVPAALPAAGQTRDQDDRGLTDTAIQPAAAPADGPIVILSVTAQQAELVRFAQLDGNLSLAMRSPADAGTSPDETTGITLRELVDRHGVLPPRAVISQFP
jgi:Flp pilus assembly protein CpaB